MAADELPQVTLARMEGKLDLCNQALSQVILTNKDHEKRIRDIESKPVVVNQDHENRIRAVETKPVVTTKMLTTAILTGTALASVIPVFNLLHTHAK